MPTSATSRGTSRPAVAQRARARRAASRSLAQKIASGRDAREQPLDRAARPALDREVVGDLDQRVVALEPARAKPVEVAEPARRPGRRPLRAVDERDPPPAGARAGGAPRRPRRGASSAARCRPARPSSACRSRDRHRGAATASACAVGELQRAEDQPVDVALRRSRRMRARPRRRRSVECRISRLPCLARDLLDRADHRRVDGVRDVRHRERDLAGAARAQAAGRRVRHVADRLGRLASRAASVSGFVLIPFSDARRRGDRHVREAGDGGERRRGGLAELLQRISENDLRERLQQRRECHMIGARSQGQSSCEERDRDGADHARAGDEGVRGRRPRRRRGRPDDRERRVPRPRRARPAAASRRCCG